MSLSNASFTTQRRHAPVASSRSTTSPGTNVSGMTTLAKPAAAAASAAAGITSSIVTAGAFCGAFESTNAVGVAAAAGPAASVAPPFRGLPSSALRCAMTSSAHTARASKQQRTLASSAASRRRFLSTKKRASAKSTNAARTPITIPAIAPPLKAAALDVGADVAPSGAHGSTSIESVSSMLSVRPATTAAIDTLAGPDVAYVQDNPPAACSAATVVDVVCLCVTR